jgi:hypothetical protein
MPRGFGGVRQASAEVEARRSSGGPSALWFRIDAGEEAIVRFLEQDDDIFWCKMHEVPVDGRNFGRDVACCNQDDDGTPCPGCERDLPRKFKGFINLIWDNAPVFKKNSEGRLEKDKDNNPIIISRKPQVAVWGSGIRVFEELDEINANFRGLRSRRFKVKRKGEKLSTKYSIQPQNVDSGPQDFSDEEKKLQAGKYDLNLFVKPPTYNEFLKELGESPNGSGGNSTPADEAANKNPFMRRKD